MSKALTKSQIASAIAEKAELSKKQAVAILEIIAALAYKNAKNSFTLPGLGKLVLVHARLASVATLPPAKPSRSRLRRS